MKKSLTFVLILFALILKAQSPTAESSLEPNFYADYYGYTLKIDGDSLRLKSNRPVKYVRVIAKNSEINYLHYEKRVKKMTIGVGHLPKGHYLVLINLDGDFILTRYNHKVKSKKPKT